MLPISVHNELTEQNRAILLDVLMFADLDARQATNPEVIALRETSLKIRSDTSPKDLHRDFSKLLRICTFVLGEIRNGATRQEAWGLEWDTYLLFNRIANNGADMAVHVRGKLMKLHYFSEEEHDDTTKEVSEPGEAESGIPAFLQR